MIFLVHLATRKIHVARIGVLACLQLHPVEAVDGVGPSTRRLDKESRQPS